MIWNVMLHDNQQSHSVTHRTQETAPPLARLLFITHTQEKLTRLGGKNEQNNMVKINHAVSSCICVRHVTLHKLAPSPLAADAV